MPAGMLISSKWNFPRPMRGSFVGNALCIFAPPLFTSHASEPTSHLSHQYYLTSHSGLGLLAAFQICNISFLHDSSKALPAGGRCSELRFLDLHARGSLQNP